MTADVELLPLRDWMECLGEISAEDIRDYARANVAHATSAKDAEIERLRSILIDLKDWDCDVSGGFLSIPVALRRRMQEAIDAHPQPASDVARLVEAPINVSYCDGNGAARSRPEDCRYGVSYVTVADTVYWPLSAEDAQLLRSAECGRGDFTGPGTSTNVAHLVGALEDIAHATATAPLQAEVDAMRAAVAEWKRVAAAQAELHGEAEDRAERMAEALRKLEEREQSDEALLRQALEALELRCGTHADERKKLIPALRERLGEGGAMIYAKETGNE